MKKVTTKVNEELAARPREEVSPLFAWFISHTFSVNEHYFSLTTNQSTVFLDMAYRPSEHGNIYQYLYPPLLPVVKYK